jgi:hypothetical protein
MVTNIRTATSSRRPSQHGLHGETTGNRMGHKVIIRQKQRIEHSGRVNNATAKRQANMVSCPPRQVVKTSRDNSQINAKYASRHEYVQNENTVQCDDEENEMSHDDEEEVCVDVPEDVEDSDDEIQEKCKNVQTNELIVALQEKENLAKQTYDSFCEKLGTMDNQTVLQETVRRATRKHAWKNYKLVDEDDYHHDSTFALFIFESLGINKQSIPSGVQRQELWLKFKKYVSEGMQAARSSATQAIKKQFIGKWR